MSQTRSALAPREPPQRQVRRGQDGVERHVPAREQRRVVEERPRSRPAHLRPRGAACPESPRDRKAERVESLGPRVARIRQARVPLEQPGGDRALRAPAAAPSHSRYGTFASASASSSSSGRNAGQVARIRSPSSARVPVERRRSAGVARASQRARSNEKSVPSVVPATPAASGASKAERSSPRLLERATRRSKAARMRSASRAPGVVRVRAQEEHRLVEADQARRRRERRGARPAAATAPRRAPPAAGGAPVEAIEDRVEAARHGAHATRCKLPRSEERMTARMSAALLGLAGALARAAADAQSPAPAPAASGPAPAAPRLAKPTPTPSPEARRRRARPSSRSSSRPSGAPRRSARSTTCGRAASSRRRRRRAT